MGGPAMKTASGPSAMSHLGFCVRVCDPDGMLVQFDEALNNPPRH